MLIFLTNSSCVLLSVLFKGGYNWSDTTLRSLISTILLTSLFFSTIVLFAVINLLYSFRLKQILSLFVLDELLFLLTLVLNKLVISAPSIIYVISDIIIIIFLFIIKSC